MFNGRQAFLAVAMENKKVALIAEDGGQNSVFSQKEFKKLDHPHPLSLLVDGVNFKLKLIRLSLHAPFFGYHHRPKTLLSFLLQFCGNAQI